MVVQKTKVNKNKSGNIFVRLKNNKIAFPDKNYTIPHNVGVGDVWDVVVTREFNSFAFFYFYKKRNAMKKEACQQKVQEKRYCASPENKVFKKKIFLD